MLINNRLEELRRCRIGSERLPTSMVTLQNVEKDSHIIIGDSIYRVMGKATMTESNKSFSKKKKYVVTEFSCVDLMSGKSTSIEWCFDDELEICITQDRMKVVNSGFSRSDIKSEMDLTVKGVKYYYDETWYAIFSRDGDEENVIINEYESHSGSLLTVEGYVSDSNDDLDYEVYLSNTLDAKDILLCL